MNIPCCPNCGLRVVAGHAELSDCILALQQEVDIEKEIQKDIAGERDNLGNYILDSLNFEESWIEHVTEKGESSI